MRRSSANISNLSKPGAAHKNTRLKFKNVYYVFGKNRTVFPIILIRIRYQFHFFFLPEKKRTTTKFTRCLKKLYTYNLKIFQLSAKTIFDYMTIVKEHSIIFTHYLYIEQKKIKKIGNCVIFVYKKKPS